jgi:thioredoxin reductase
VIRNRILQSGHVTGFGEHGLPTERHLRYYETRAKGGIGLIVMEAVAISPHGHIIPHVVQGWRDEVIPWFRRISDAVHAHGAKIFCQAWHNGNKNNEADMVVMTRATICDPEMPNKAREGRVDDVRMCIACNEGCWERITQRDPITCMQNPETGREGIFKILPAPNPRKILVAGGGVAGMEAAIVARQRGHQVVLCEKTGELGGAVLIWTKAPARQEASQTVRFMKHELERLGVEVRLNTQVTPALVETERPDAIIVATGATTVENPLPDVVGPDAAIEIERGAHVVTAEDVLDGKTQTGQRVVVADFQNYMKGLVTAEVLADQGKEVTVIMPLPFRLLGNNPYDMDGPTHVIQLVNLTAKKVKRVSDFEVKRARPGKVTIRNVFTEQEQDLDADTLVLSYWRKADKKLYNELQGKVKELHKIGDCVASRRLINAIYEGYKVAMEI